MADNGSGPAKARLRAELVRPLAPGTRVLELFAGEGYLYRQVWHRFERGATLDKDPAKVTAAALERPTWACYEGDAERLLAAGWFAAVPFDVVDIDAWGSPWKFLGAWFEPRARAAETLVVLTDGYGRQRSIAPLDQVLFGAGQGRRTLTEEDYRCGVDRALARWDAAAGTTTEVERCGELRRPRGARGTGKMRAWVLRVRAGGAGPQPAA